MTSLLSGAQILALDPNDIDDSNRIGFLHEDKAAAIGRLMAVDGQRDPIKVTKAKNGSALPWTLVVGKHRTIGARLEGIPVYAIEVSGKPEDLEDLEASENKHRRTLNPLEDAKFVAALADAARKRIARQNGNLKQQQLAVRARWNRAKQGEISADQALRDEVEDTQSHFATAYGVDATSWEKAVGEAFGMSRDAIYRALRLHRHIVLPFPELVEDLSRHPVVGDNAKQLREIADIPDEAKRRDVIERLLADHELSADGARVLAGIGLGTAAGAEPLPHMKHLNAAVGNIARLSASLQKRHLPEIIRAFKSDDVKRQLRDLLNEELGE